MRHALTQRLGGLLGFDWRRLHRLRVIDDVDAPTRVLVEYVLGSTEERALLADPAAAHGCPHPDDRRAAMGGGRWACRDCGHEGEGA